MVNNGNNKLTLVIGASLKEHRYSNICIRTLRNHNIPTIAYGKKEGWIADVLVQNTMDIIEPIHTVTLYLNPANQESLIPFILNLRPKRIIFNPGTENPEFEKLAAEKGIEIVEACTIVMLKSGEF